MMKSSMALLCPILLLTLLPIPMSPQIASAGQVIDVDGIQHVRNGDRPTNGAQTLHLDELWRAGGEDDEESMFGLITKVDTDKQGNIYLLDPQMLTVHVYSSDGAFIGDIFRQGQGPGEIGFPRDMCMTPDGNITIIQPGPNGLVKVDTEGTGAGMYSLKTNGGGRAMPTSINAGGSNTVAAVEEAGEGATPGTGTRTSILVSLDAAGNEIARYLSTSRDYDYNNHAFRERGSFPDFMWSYAVDDDGRVYALPERDEYGISVFSPAGDLLRVIERRFAPWRRTPQDAARMRRLAERRFRTFPFDLSYEFEETEAVVSWVHRGLQIDDDGMLWVRHARSGRNQTEGDLLTFDIFDRSGHFDRQVTFTCPGDGLVDGVFLLGGDRVLVVRGFVDALRDWYGGGRGSIGEGDDVEEPAPIEIICYRVGR
ncbi:MAG: hypothetical protein GY835_08375 [bacterium]|nr:hypothetical protein [bacterium]